MADHQVQLDQCLQRVCCAEAKGSYWDAHEEALWCSVPEQGPGPQEAHTKPLCGEQSKLCPGRSLCIPPTLPQRRPHMAPA